MVVISVVGKLHEHVLALLNERDVQSKFLKKRAVLALYLFIRVPTTRTRGYVLNAKTFT